MSSPAGADRSGGCLLQQELAKLKSVQRPVSEFRILFECIGTSVAVDHQQQIITWSLDVDRKKQA